MPESFTPEQIQAMKLAQEAVKAGASPVEVVNTSEDTRAEAKAERLKKATEIFNQAVAEGHPNPAERVVEILGQQEPGMAEDEAHAELLKLAELVAQNEAKKAA